MLCKYIEHNKLYIEQFHDLYIYISSPYIMQLQYSLYYCPYDAIDFKK